MKTINKNIFLGCILCAVIMISACGKKDNTDIESIKVTTIKETQEFTKAEDNGSFPSENQMAEDIESFGANVISLENGEYTLETKSIKIDKAKKDSEQYLVYCTASQESDMFKANNSYVMEYNYYDIGGWILDVCYVEKVDMIPKTAIEEEKARSYVYSDFTTLEVSEVEKISDVEYVYHYVGKYEYEYMDDVYNVDVTCTYDNDYGWQLYSDIVFSYHDWSKMCGTWSGKNLADSEWTYKIVVKDVDESTGQVQCDVILTHPKRMFKDMLGEDKKLTAMDLTAEILDDEEYFNDIDEEDGFEYNAEIKNLCTYNSSLMNTKVTAFLEICWGRNVGMSKVLLYDGEGGMYFSYLTKEK